VGAAALALPGQALAGILGDSARPHPDFKRLAQTHDLPSLPAWGPYSKKYFGVSHVPAICFFLADWIVRLAYRNPDA
jgi:hypothetical protein